MLVFNWFLVRLKTLRNYLKENKREFFFHDLWHTLIIILGLVLFYLFLVTMFGFIEKKNLPALDFAFILFSFSLLTFLPLVFYSGLICSLSFLFQREELQFYFSLPVNKLAVFSLKFIQTYFHSVWMAFLGFLTFIVAIQIYFKATPLIYLSASAAFLVLLLVPVCLAVILVLAVSRFIPFVRAKGILTVTGLLVGSVLVALIRLMQPERIVSAEGKLRLVTFIETLHKPWMTAFPSEWVTNILFSQIYGDKKGLLFNFSGLLVLAMVLLMAVYFLAHLFYQKIWTESQFLLPHTHKKFRWQPLVEFFPLPLRAFIRKDLLSFYRDTIEKGSLLILIPLAFVYLYSIYQINRQMQGAAEPLFSFLSIYLFNFFYASVIIAGLSGRWVFPGISAEGNNFKLIRASPVSLKDFLKAKFLLGFLPLLFIGEILILSSAFILHFPLAYMLASAIITVALCAGLTSICLIFGMRQADFSIKTPLEFALSIKGFLCLAWEFIFVAAVIVLIGIPAALFLSRGFSKIYFLSLCLSCIPGLLIFGILRHAYKVSLALLSKKEI